VTYSDNQDPYDRCFTQAARDWDLERLYPDLADIEGRPELRPFDKAALRGLLLVCGPTAIAACIGWTPRAVSVELSKRLYRFIEQLTGHEENSIKYQLVHEWLRKAGYMLPKPPFGDTGRITDPDRFFDREELLRQIFEALHQGSSISLVGESQIGKSSILSMICQLGPERLQLPLDRFIDLDMQYIRNEGDFFEALCCELALDETYRGYRLLRALAGRSYILCLDEIERMINQEAFTNDLRTELRGLADGADSRFTLVIASRSSLDELFPDSPLQTSPLSGICRQLDVLPFSEEDTREFLTQRLAGTDVSFTDQEMTDLFAQTNGHPGYLQRSADILWRHRGESS